jgi:hypothetical protein
VWLVYAPTGGLASATISGSRSSKIQDLITAAGGPGDLSTSAFLSAKTMPISIITTNIDGTCLLPYRRPKTGGSSGMHDAMKALMNRAPWDQETGAFGSSPYFSGEF